jgi:hypothetical protein
MQRLSAVSGNLLVDHIHSQIPRDLFKDYSNKHLLELQKLETRNQSISEATQVSYATLGNMEKK